MLTPRSTLARRVAAALDASPSRIPVLLGGCGSGRPTLLHQLKDRIGRGLERFRQEFPDVTEPALVVAGGVAANKVLRTTLQELCDRNHFRFVAPPHRLCTDNAAMIAWAGLERMADGRDPDPLEIPPRSRWPLDGNAETLIGFGKRGAKA